MASVFWNGAAFAQVLEPTAARLFFDEHPVLQFIEQRLAAGATVLVPPDAAQPQHVVTDAELRAAFSRALDDFLAPPSTFAGKAGDLISEVCRYRPEQTVQWIGVAADGILKHSLAGADVDLENAVTSAVAANPPAAGAVVGRVFRSIAAAVEARGRPLEIAIAGRYAATAVRAALNVVKNAPDAAQLIKAIADQALHEAAGQEANYLAVETMAAAAESGRGIDRGLGELCQMAFSKHDRSKEQAGILCAGALKGAGVEAASVTKNQAALALPVPFAAYTVIVCNAYFAVSGSPEPERVIAHFITVSNADFIPAVMIGAIVAAPGAAPEILRVGLNRDLVFHGRATTREIVEAAVMACEQRAPELAAAAVGHGDLMEGNAAAQIAEAVARAVLPSQIGAAIAAQIKAQENRAEEIRAMVAGAMAGAATAKRRHAQSAIASAATAGSGLGFDVLDQAIISAPPELQYFGVLGAMAADREHASALLDRALHHRDLASGQAAPIAAGGGVILEIQKNPRGFFGAAVSRLFARENTSAEITMAIVLATALANPRGASAVAAAAAAATPLAPATLISTASRGDRGLERGIAEAVEIAVHVKSDASDLFRFVRDEITANPDRAPDIVTGAMAAAPSAGHVIAQAAAVAAPAAVARVVPCLFAFSAVRNPIARQTESAPDALAALTDGVLRGIANTNLDAASESRVVTEAVAASVKSVLAITRDSAAALSRDEALAAVLIAATRGAGTHAAEIARTTGRAVRALGGEAADQAKIRDAVLAARPPVDAAKIADAVAAGFAEADLQVPAPGAKALVDYAHDSLTGPSMTSFLDL